MIAGRVQVPPQVKRGEPFEVRVLVNHVMETGFRRDLEGRVIPLHILDRISCTFGGREVFRAELGSGMAANPLVSFFMTAAESGELAVQWSDDRGGTGGATAMLNVA